MKQARHARVNATDNPTRARGLAESDLGKERDGCRRLGREHWKQGASVWQGEKVLGLTEGGACLTRCRKAPTPL